MASGKLSPFHPISLIATWFGSGLLPKAPGTWGSLGALPFAYAIAWIGGWQLLLAAALLAFVIGIWAGGVYAERMNLKDPGEVVIDEVAGQWLALLPVALSLEYYPLAFLAFRFFDITKIWPAKWADQRLSGGLGIMVDDMVAGLYAAIVCILAVYLVGSF
ncbi:MAG: phosphatidylglycerophosphatase A [Pseudomonadota bacterium]